MTVTEEQNHYETLRVSPEATRDEIKKAFRSLMREHHPDVAGPEGQETSTRVSMAYEVLSNEQSREAYDRMLAGEPDPDAEPEEEAEYTEAWGQEAEWEAPEEDVEVEVEEELDDVVVDEGPVPGTDTQPEGREYEGEAENSWPLPEYPEPDFIYPARLTWPWVGAWGLGGLLGALLTMLGSGPDQINNLGAKAVAAVTMIVLGSIAGALVTKRVHKQNKPWTLRRGVVSGAGFLLLGLAAGLMVYFLVPGGLSIVGGAIATFLFAAGGAVACLSMLRDQKALEQFIEIDSLRKNNCFGGLPGGVAADLLNNDLSRLFDIPSLRMLRSDDPQRPFSHALLVGDRLVLVRAIQADGGMFRWSGPSLLRQGAEGYPEEIMTGQYAQALAEARAAFPEGEVSSWVLIYSQDKVWGSPDPQHPTISAPSEGVQAMGDFLVEDGASKVSHQRVVEGMFALTG